MSAFTQARTGLTAQTRIFYRGYATNSVGTAYSPDGSFFTEPATQASTVNFTSVTSTGMTVNWTRGSAGAGGGVLVVMKAATAVDAIPADGTYTSYTANTVFGSGTAITANNFVVFKGTGTSVAVTGLTAGSTYHVAVFEFAGQADTSGVDQGTNYKLTPATGNQITTVGAPTLTTPTAAAIGSTTATLGATVTSNGGASLTARGTCWGLSTAPVGNCVAEGGTAVSAFTHARTGLDEGSLVYYRGYATNSGGTGYSTDGIIYTEPTQPHTLTFSGVGQTGMTVGWTIGSAGNADNVIVVMRQGAAPSPGPADSTTYTANAAFGSGTALGGGFVVYKGTGSSVTVSGLTENTTYYANIYAFAAGAGGTENYNVTSPLAGNQATLPTGPVCTPAAMSISVAPATQNVRPGFAITYNITVVNNDSVECSNLTVNLGLGDNPTTPTANFAASTLSVPSLVVAPQNSGGATLTVTAQGAGAELSQLTTTVTATAGGHAAQNDSVVSTILDYNPLIHSSRSTNSTKWGVNGWGIAGGQYGEITCATCHTNGATPNIKRIRSALSATFGSRAVSLTTTNEVANPTGNGFGDDSDARGATNSNRICEVCHTITTFHRVTTTSTPDLTHYNNTDCITCHQHSKGFDASCTTCHGNPPVDSGTLVQPSSRPTGSLTAGAHGAHNTLGIACARCHFNSVGGGATHDVNGQVSLGFVNLPTGTGGSTGGTYNGQTTVTYNWTDGGTTGTNNGNKTCANYCHGSTISGTGAVWDNPTSGTCGNCHKATNADPPTRVNHPRHAGTAAAWQLGLACDKCHGASYAGGSAPANHMNGSVTYDVSGLTGATPTYRGNAGAQSTGTIAPSGTYGNCASVYCHSNVQSINGTAAASIYATPTWGAASVTCDSCHGSGVGNGRPNTGAHLIHVTTRGYACSVCHSGAGDETAVHANGTINISISATYGGTYSQGSHTPGTGGYGTCSNVNCHNMKVSLAWGSTGTSCTLCHTVDGANSATVANPVSGLHGNTVVSVQDHDSTLAGGCEACHVKASISGHWDGVASATADYTKAQVGITAAWYTDATGTGATRGTCMGNPALGSCHTDKGYWRRQWSTNADVDITTSKLPGQAVCNVCHGQYSTLANSTGWNEGTVHFRSGSGAAENKGSIHTDAGDECEDCHGYDSAAVHNSNNLIDFSDLGNPSGYAVTLNTTPNPDVWYCATCHNTHNTQDATLTDTRTFLDSLAFPNSVNHVTGSSVPEGACDSCHGGGSTGTGAKSFWPDSGVKNSDTVGAKPNDEGAHVKHMTVIARRLYNLSLTGLLNDAASADKQKAICEYCHAAVTNDDLHMAGDDAEVFVTNIATVSTRFAKHLNGAADGNALYISGGNCQNVACHNSKETTTVSRNWYSGATTTCTMCHTNNGSANNPISGLHNGSTPTISGQKHDDTVSGGCAACHTMPDLTTTQTNSHINASFQGNSTLAGDRTALGLTFSTTNGYTQTVDNVGSCVGTWLSGCHANQLDAGTWARKWDSAIHYAATAPTSYVTCAGCHGGFGTNDWTFGSNNAVGDFSVSHARDWNTSNTTETDNIIGLHSNNTNATKCNSCHVYSDVGYATLGTYGTGTHGTGTITMNQTAVYSGTTFGCTNTCHVKSGEHVMESSANVAAGSRIQWVEGPAMSCSTCHSGYTTHIDADGPGTAYTSGTCTDCHLAHADGTSGHNDVEISTVYTGTTAVPTMTQSDGTTALYSSHGYKIRLGGNATVGKNVSGLSITFTAPNIIAGTNIGAGTLPAAFQVGDIIQVKGSTSNGTDAVPKYFTVTVVAANQLTVAETIVAEGASATEVISSSATEAQLCWNCHMNIGSKKRTGTTLAFTTGSITDSANGFVTAGFQVGDYIIATGSAQAGNNGRWVKVTGVTTNALTVAAATFTASAAGSNVTIKSPISEWGATAHTSVGGSAYDMGLLTTDVTTTTDAYVRTSNWTTGNWRSAKGLTNAVSTTSPFWYKRGKVRSTHSANFDGTTVTAATGDGAKPWKGSITNTGTAGYSTTYNKGENLDDVANIRCSYCHDVHGTHNGTKGDLFGGAGGDAADRPYLRGTWLSNPYPEDGAPRYNMTTFTLQADDTTTAETEFGRVPRASADPANTGLSTVAQVGGFWIDQNSGNPVENHTTTAFRTADGFAGLCAQCHGTADYNGLWTAAEIGAIDQITGEGLWVSGASYNAHSNVVMGGAGPGTAGGVENRARNIFTRTLRSVGYPSVTGFASNASKQAVDMGLATQTGSGYSYRSNTTDATNTLDWLPPVGNTGETIVEVGRPYAYRYFAWNNVNYDTTAQNSSIATGSIDLLVTNEPELATETAHDAQPNYHTFSCSKCHNAHASRLPKLMNTNCLDTNHNTWEDKNTFTGSALTAPWTGMRHSQWASAQNCHRLDARATTVTGASTALGKGWNFATPWKEDATPNPASGSGKTADISLTGDPSAY